LAFPECGNDVLRFSSIGQLRYAEAFEGTLAVAIGDQPADELDTGVPERFVIETDWILGRIINLDEKKKAVKAYATVEYFPNRCRWGEEGFEVTSK